MTAISTQLQRSATRIKQFYSMKILPHSLLMELSINACTYICVRVTTVGQYKGLAPILSHPGSQIGCQTFGLKLALLIHNNTNMSTTFTDTAMLFSQILAFPDT